MTSDLSLPKKLAWILVLLAFFSKISFAFLGFMPNQSSYLIFQFGLHPYLNVALNFTFGGALIFLLLRALPLDSIIRSFHPLYRSLVVLMITVLSIQTILQLIDNPDLGVGIHLATLLSTIFLILAFGMLIPLLLPLDEVINRIAVLCWILILVSLALYFMGSPTVFKGNRFIGIFKHIPYMVTCASIGFLFNLDRWHRAETPFRYLFLLIQQSLFVYALYLTGTRSALSAIIVGTSLQFFLYSSKSQIFRMSRVMIVWITVLGMALFGGEILQFGKDVFTGERAIGQREAQDGVSDRLDEIYRGLDLLEKSPNIGLGLLSKFGSAEGEDVVESYNSFQDPHNLFISSAVIAGWPFALVVIFGFACLILRTGFAVLKENPPWLTLGVYVLSHLPILFIYHMHLSLGGLADRMYWICFGYLGLHFLQRRNEKNIITEP